MEMAKRRRETVEAAEVEMVRGGLFPNIVWRWSQGGFLVGGRMRSGA